MKKLLLLLVSCLFVIPSFGQAIDTRRVEKYANALYRENGKKKWRAAASDLTNEVKFDINDNLSFVRIVECENISKDNLYMTLNHWFTMTFNDANSVIKLNDREQGVIIANGYISNVAEHRGTFVYYKIDVKPIIKVDIKDNRIRITYTIQSYTFNQYNGRLIGSSNVGIKSCFPFKENDSHKNASAKAFVMTVTYAKVLIDKIEKAVQEGLVGNENDDW